MATFAQTLAWIFIIWELLSPWILRSTVCGETQTLISYTREAQLLLSPRSVDFNPIVDLVELKWNSDQHRRPRKRGRRGGVLQRLRRRSNRPPLPSIILGNARSLRTKMDELRINARSCFEYRDLSLMAFTETWLHKDIPSSLVELEGFSLIRADRGKSSGKDRGGGVCVYMSNRWCTQYTVRETGCTPDAEYLCLSLRPFYLPREFGNVIMCVVCIPPSRAALSISDCIQKQLQ